MQPLILVVDSFVGANNCTVLDIIFDRPSNCHKVKVVLTDLNLSFIKELIGE